MLGFPASTEFGKRIPKQKFYENLDVSPALRRVFVDQIRLVYWRNKLAASTLNIAAGEAVTEIVRAIGTHLVADEHGLYDVVQILFGGLTVLLVKREEDKREHDNHHQHCRRRQVEMRLRQKEDRDTDCRSDGKTNELPLGQVEHDLRFDAVKILRDRNKCH